MRRETFTWKIGGVGGQGQQAAGAAFAKCCLRSGYHAVTYSEFPSIIRGGHGTTAVSLAKTPLTAPFGTVHLLVALNDETIQLHQKELAADGAVLYDADKVSPAVARGSPQRFLPVPFGRLVQDAKLPPVTANMAAVGASLGLLGVGAGVVAETMAALFGRKGAATVSVNVKAAQVGHAAVQHIHPEHFPYRLTGAPGNHPPPLLTGNDALSLGLVAAGCQIYVAYPMSPSSAILHHLATWAKKTGMVVRQPEDEIAGIHVAIGANFTGTRAAVGTSGGGFALMNEAVTLAAMTETPLVAVVCSRPGPATGLPTWTEQGDLKYLVNCGHGDFPRVVLTPGDPAEAYTAVGTAFNLAETYQLPVFILMDKLICETGVTLPDFSPALPAMARGKILDPATLKNGPPYQRYALTPDGVSPRALPGMPGGIHLANSDEHDEMGWAIESFGAGEAMRRRMMEKRFAKVRGILAELPKPVRFGPATADLTLVGWGSTKGPALAALRELPYVNYVHLPAVWPLPEHEVMQLLSSAKLVVTVENNFSGQFATLLRGATGFAPHHQLHKYNGQPFFPEELVEKVKALL